MSQLISTAVWVITFIIGLSVVAVFLSMFRRAKPTKEVLFCRPRDRRGERLFITRETDRSLICGKSNPIHRFIKVSQGYTFTEGGRTIIRFFGIEGTAYTGGLSNPSPQKLPLRDYLRALWGDKFYEKIPEKQREAVENDVVGVTVEPVQINEEEYNLPTLTSDDINDESDAVILERLARESSGSVRREIYQLIVGILIGAGMVFFALRMGWV